MELGKNSPFLTIVHDGWDFFGEILEELVVKAGEAEKMPNSAFLGTINPACDQ